MIYTKTFRMMLMTVAVVSISQVAFAPRGGEETSFWAKIQQSASDAAAKGVADVTSETIGSTLGVTSRLTKAATNVVERKALGALQGFPPVSAQVQEQIARNVESFKNGRYEDIAKIVAQAKWRQAAVAKEGASSYNKWVYFDSTNTFPGFISNAKTLSNMAKGSELAQIQVEASYINELVRQLEDAGVDKKDLDTLFLSESEIKRILEQMLGYKPTMQATSETSASTTALHQANRTEYNWGLMQAVYDAEVATYYANARWLSWWR